MVSFVHTPLRLNVYSMTQPPTHLCSFSFLRFIINGILSGILLGGCESPSSVSPLFTSQGNGEIEYEARNDLPSDFGNPSDLLMSDLETPIDLNYTQIDSMIDAFDQEFDQGDQPDSRIDFDTPNTLDMLAGDFTFPSLPDLGSSIELDMGNPLEADMQSSLELDMETLPELDMETLPELDMETLPELDMSIPVDLDMEIPAQSSFTYNLCGLGRTEPRPTGTFEEPIQIGYSPFLDRNSTQGTSQDRFNRYDCRPNTQEYGPERVYQFTLTHPSFFRAEVLDPIGVDIDLHLLQNPQINSEGYVQGCLEGHDRLIEYTRLEPGIYWLVADTWTNRNQQDLPGSYSLALEWIAHNEWTSAPLAHGVTLKRKWERNDNDIRMFHVIEIEPDALEMSPQNHQGCQTLDGYYQNHDALIAMNANFFSQCTPTDLLKIGGNLITSNQTTSFEQRSVGWTMDQQVLFDWIDPNQDWPAAYHAIGGYPSLVIDREVRVEVYEGEQVYSQTDWQNNPRSAFGQTDQDTFIFAVVDGRNPTLSQGLTNMAWAQWLHREFNLTEALGFDGGGSSTLYVKDCSLNQIINFPSGGSGGHTGTRAVASSLAGWE